MSLKLYILLDISMLILAYIIPYLVLRECRDLSLFLFWLFISIIVFASSMIYLARGVEK